MRISTREKVLLTGLFIAALVYLTFTYVLTPNFEEKDNLEIRRTELQVKLDQLNNTKIETDLDESIGEAYSIIDDIAVNYFNDTNQEEFILLSNDLFEVDDMSANDISYSKPEVEMIIETNYLSTNIDIAFEGDYSALMNILDTVWAYPKFLQVQSLNLSVVEIIGEAEDADSIYTEVVEETLVVATEEVFNTEEVVATEEAVNTEEVAVTEETVVTAVIDNDNEPKVIVSGSVSLKIMNVLVDSSVVDELYTWYIDEEYVKENPFTTFTDKNTKIRYIYTGAGANLFNFDRFKDFIDITGHRMEDEIREFLEKGYIYTNNNNTFNPDQPITRGEFVVLLDSVYEWTGYIVEEVDITQFKDYDTLGDLEDSFAKAIQKGIQRGYIKGYADNTLALNAPITYKEVELVMQRVQRDEGFTWDEVAKSIVVNKSITSARWDDKTLGVTKAEAVYLLTNFK